MSYAAFRVPKQLGRNKSAYSLPGYLLFIYALTDTWTEIWEWNGQRAHISLPVNTRGASSQPFPLTPLWWWLRDWEPALCSVSQTSWTAHCLSIIASSPSRQRKYTSPTCWKGQNVARVGAWVGWGHSWEGGAGTPLHSVLPCSEPSSHITILVSGLAGQFFSGHCSFFNHSSSIHLLSIYCMPNSTLDTENTAQTRQGGGEEDHSKQSCLHTTVYTGMRSQPSQAQ
jgi:hypothetical protein